MTVPDLDPTPQGPGPEAPHEGWCECPACTRWDHLVLYLVLSGVLALVSALLFPVLWAP